MDILILFCDLEGTVLHITDDTVQTTDDLQLFFHGQDTLFCQHSHMSLAAANILGKKFLVKSYGRIKIVDQLISLFGKASAP